MKHAYLVIANKNPEQLQLLINMLDDYRNDIYVLIDKKSREIQENFRAVNSSLYLLPRIEINWGDYSQIKAELYLLKTALDNGDYDYFHLLSGLDLPIATQDEIHDFFDKHKGTEFVSYNKLYKSSTLKFLRIKFRDKSRPKKKRFLSDYKTTNMISSRIRKHLFRNQYKKKSFFMSIYRKMENNFLPLLPSFSNVGFASQWFSIDLKLANDLIINEHKIKRRYKNGVLVDEVFLPTFINEHIEFKKRLFQKKAFKDTDLKLKGNLRLINWTENSLYTGSPDVLTLKDRKKICEARKEGFLFARKFDCNVDREIISLIYKKFNQDK